VRKIRRKRRPPATLPWRRRWLAHPIVLVAFCTPALAQGVPDFNNYGGTGLLDMPTGMMAPDGHLVLSASYQQDIQHYNLTFQALPWLETSFRYSGLQHYNIDYPVYWDRAFAIKARLFQETDITPAIAVGINDLVGTGIYSSEYIVATKNFGSLQASVGIGWGRLGTANPFRNPFSLISKSFNDRTTGFTGLGGEFSFDKYFHGPASIFGGLAWRTPIDNLTLKTEYSSDRYDEEAQRGGLSPKSQFNFGASYRAWDNMVFGLSWMYGRSLAGSIAFDLDPTRDSFPQRIGPAPVPLYFRSPADQAAGLRALKGESRVSVAKAAMASGDELWALPGLQNVAIAGASLELTLAAASQRECERLAGTIDAAALHVTNIVLRDSRGGKPIRCAVRLPGAPYFQAAAYGLLDTNLPALSTGPMVIDAVGPSHASEAKIAAKIRADAVTQRLIILTLSMHEGTATIYYGNSHYRVEAEAIDRLLRIAMADTPPDIEQFRFIAVRDGRPAAEYTVLRATAERTFQQEGRYDLLANNSDPSPVPMSNPALRAAAPKLYPNFSWVAFPQLRQEFFDPSNPLGIQLVAGVAATVEVLPGFTMNGEAETSLFDTFNTARPSDSVLPHVRTDFLQYFSQGKTGIGALYGDYHFRLSPTVFGAVRAGYLESMFAGVGGEILWRPEGQRWALGADLYEVKQRAFNRLFGFQPYSQTTGHITLYYDSPWYNLDFKLRAGQYLAGDRGMTFQVSRRFSTGVEIGVFATKTNVSTQQFGEGSFDKGIFIHIPLTWVLPIHSQTSLNELLRPVQRDGGQILNGDATLFESTRGISESDAHLTQLSNSGVW
jgi:hypothetical protein